LIRGVGVVVVVAPDVAAGEVDVAVVEVDVDVVAVAGVVVE
jgi:hypothetical protein